MVKAEMRLPKVQQAFLIDTHEGDHTHISVDGGRGGGLFDPSFRVA